jgi:hypothetical protein
MLALMQGLGEGPARLLAGASDGSICLLEDVTEAEAACLLPEYVERRGLRPCANVKLSCMAATDEVVVNGFDDGGIQVVRMANPLHTQVA